MIPECSIFQAAQGMTNPRITICPNSNPGILSRAMLLSLYAGQSQIDYSEMGKQTGEAYLRVVQLMKNMDKVYQELSRLSPTGVETNKSSETLTKLNMWGSNKENLLDGALLPAFVNFEKYLSRIPTIPEENIVMCQVQNMGCSKKQVIDNTLYTSLNGGLITRFKVDITLGGSLNPAITQGTSNALTLILLIGTNMIDKVINKTFSHPIPFFDDIVSPSSGSSGLKLIVHRPETISRPLYEGINIPTGMEASIGITARKISHLPESYTKCGEKNDDAELYYEVVSKVGKLRNMPIQGREWGAYLPGRCRYNNKY